jgi:isopenicillin N synthase-like dioxygenase
MRIRDLPVVDLGPVRAGRAGAADEAAATLRAACEKVGFYFLVDHGIPQTLIDEAFEANARFFDSPLERKLTVRIDHQQSGFQPLKQSLIRSSDVNDNTKADVCEIMILRRDLPPDHPDVIAGKRFRQPNKWPSWQPGFRDTFRRYLDSFEGLGRSLLPLYARALSLPDDFFLPFFVDAQIAISVAHYPPDDAPEPNQFGLAPHTDAGFLTMIAQSATPGLELRLSDGEWIAPPTMPGAILVNTGDTLRRWTNDRFVSTPHRVVVSRGRHRHSNPFFYNPALDAQIACLPSCCGPDEPAKHKPIRYGDYYEWYITQNYAHLKPKPREERP